MSNLDKKDKERDRPTRSRRKSLARFGRKSSASVEDYLLQIHRLSKPGQLVRGVDLAACLGIAAPSVTGMVRRLAEQGLLCHQAYRGIALTAQGASIALRLDHHRTLLERFLLSLGIDEQTVRQDAEGMKHWVSDATCTALQKWMDGETRRQAAKSDGFKLEP